MSETKQVDEAIDVLEGAGFTVGPKDAPAQPVDTIIWGKGDGCIGGGEPPVGATLPRDTTDFPMLHVGIEENGNVELILVRHIRVSNRNVGQTQARIVLSVDQVKGLRTALEGVA
jgi:hypothetical protein